MDAYPGADAMYTSNKLLPWAAERYGSATKISEKKLM